MNNKALDNNRNLNVCLFLDHNIFNEKPEVNKQYNSCIIMQDSRIIEGYFLASKKNFSSPTLDFFLLKIFFIN